MSKKTITKLLVAFVLGIAILGTAIYFIKENSLKNINKDQINVSFFIDAVDDVSENKAQINWKYVASIIGVVNKNSFNNVSESQIKEISKKFLFESDGKYKVLNLENVIKKLNLSDKEKDRVNKYVNDLDNFGLTPERLKPELKYSKFITGIKEAAIENYEKYKVLPSITIAQAILESNWGESKLSSKYNNLFGIKPGSKWKGETVAIETSEFYNQKINDKFRVYNDKNESIKDHALVLYENKRYEKVLNQNTYIGQASALETQGYSTVSDKNGNKTYKKLLMQLIQQYNLNLIDSKAQEQK